MATDPRGRELVEFALERLPTMRLDDGAFCHEVYAPELRPHGRSLRYTLMCLLGLERAHRSGWQVPVAPGELRALAIEEIDSEEMSIGDLGLLLWADTRMGGAAIDAIAYRLHGREGEIDALEGLELSWVVIGAAEAGAEELLDRVLAVQLARARTSSGLFAHTGSGRRARFPNFATEIYGVLACALAARAGRAEALGVALTAADRLLKLQRPDGGWPWIFDTESGRVVEPYEIYAVHQDAMAPMALFELSDVSGDERYREAALRGLDWIFGPNELDRPILDRQVGIVYRSIRRRKPLDRALLYANTALAATGVAGRSAHANPSRLELNPTDRPYHLGWILEAWAGVS